VVNCAVEEGHFDNDVSQIIDLQHYIGNTVDIYYRDIAKRQLGVVRGRLSLVLESSMLGEKLLQACEAALGEAGLGDVALKLRVDCVRMETEMTTNGTSESLCNEAVKFVILSVFRMELLPPDMDYINGRKEIDERGNWDKLLKTVYEEPLGDFRDFKSPVLGLTVDNSTTPWADAQTDPTLTPCLLSIQQLRSLGIPATQVLFDALHLLYEDMKLRSSMRGCGVCWIGSILSSVCEMALCNSAIFADVPRNYLSHYARDLHSAPAPLGFDNQESGAFQLSRKVSYPQVSLSSLQTPPCILGWIEQCLSGNAVSNQYAGKTDASKVNAACERTITVLRIFSFVRKGKLFKCHTADQSLDTDFEIAKLLVQEGFVDTAAVHDEFTAGLALPLLEALHRCRSKQIDSGLNADAQVWSLIGRNDLYYNLDVSQNILQWMPRVFGKRPSTTHNEGSFAIESREKDGVSQLESSSSMLFPADNRLREVCRLLRSSRPIYLRVPRAIEFTDHDYERKKQEKLLLLSRRVLALPIGRGMLTVGNLKPVPAEPLSLPDICLSARVPPTNATLALDTSECPADMKVWPEFHNGVAAGLRLPMQCERGDSVSKITRTWIVYNRSSSNRPLHSHANDNSGGVVQSLDHGHGGLLMALGMRGYLSALEMTDVFDYLTHGTITTTVGTLLGMAAK
jgi:anaphase-promoting complex subunit 1